MPLPKRDIEEIVELHAREGSQLQEVFVEGNEDKRFYETFLAQHGLARVAVLDVETVNVPDAEVLKIGLAVGKKGRVVTLAALLEDKLAENQVVCIADADLDHFKGTTYDYSLLIITDYTSIELYVMCPSVIQRILQVALGGFPKSREQVASELATLLQDAFIVRVAVDDLKLAPSYPEHWSFCDFDKKRSAVQFRLKEYINKAFEGCADKSWREPLMAKIEERRKQLKQDPRLQIHGHDFVGTLCWYIRRHAGYGHLNPATLAEILLGFVDAAALADEPLFRELLRRLRSA